MRRLSDSEYLPAEDASQAAWLAERLRPWPRDDGGVYVDSIIPTGFASYARIFHPAKTSNNDREVTWAKVARHHHRTPHAEMQWHAITGGGQSLDFEKPERYEGSLPVKQRHALIDVLRGFTKTPGDCYFSFWEGWGGLDAKTRWPRAPQFKLPGRTYVLRRGPIEAVMNVFPPLEPVILHTCRNSEPIEAAMDPIEPPPWDQSPSLWWPADRAWCVATEVDCMWTYVGGSDASINAVLRDDRLEAWLAKPDHRVDIYGDRINLLE